MSKNISKVAIQKQKPRVDTRMAKNATTCLFASYLGYAYGEGDKSTACSTVRSYFIGYFDEYFDAVNSDYFCQRRQLPAQILAKVLHFQKCKYIFIECDKSVRHSVRVSRMRCK